MVESQSYRQMFFQIKFDRLFELTFPSVVHVTLGVELHVDWDACVRLVHVAELSSDFVVKEFVALRAEKEIDALVQLYHRLPVCDAIERPLASFRSTSETLCLMFPLYGNVRNRRLESAAALWSIAAQLTDALVALKEARILHRNITTGNVLVDESLRLRLIDFGDAVVWTSDREELDVPTNGHFRPPENECTFASDVFSAGVVLATFYLNCGEILFEFDCRDQALAALANLSTERPRLAHFWTPFNGAIASVFEDVEFERLIWRMLEIDPNERIDAREAKRLSDSQNLPIGNLE
jgi:serine/threonine protein kinase